MPVTTVHQVSEKRPVHTRESVLHAEEHPLCSLGGRACTTFVAWRPRLGRTGGSSCRAWHWLQLVCPDLVSFTGPLARCASLSLPLCVHVAPRARRQDTGGAPALLPCLTRRRCCDCATPRLPRGRCTTRHESRSEQCASLCSCTRAGHCPTLARAHARAVSDDGVYLPRRSPFFRTRGESSDFFPISEQGLVWWSLLLPRAQSPRAPSRCRSTVMTVLMTGLS